MSTTRIIINVLLLVAAALNFGFALLYYTRSNWRATLIGRNLLTAKALLGVVCLIFPVFSFIGYGDGTFLRLLEIVLFVVLIGTFVFDIVQLVLAQRHGHAEEP